ncbi:MAG: response regulator [Pseudomonadales bacterium]
MLLVDSDLRRGAVLANQLVDLEVSCVAGGRAALQAATEQAFDCAVVRQVLSDYDGLWLVNMLRKNTDLSLLPVILVTTDGAAAEAVVARRAGAADYLSATVLEPETLLCVIQQVVDRAQLMAATDEQLQVLQQHNNELQRRYAALSENRQKLATKMLTPLTAAQEFISLVLDGAGGAVSERQGKLLALARGSCVQLGNAVQEYLEPPENQGLQPADFGQLALEQWLDEALEIFALQAAHRGVHFGCVVDPALELVCLDEYRLREVLLFVIPRLLDACTANDAVRLTAQPDPMDSRSINFSLRARLGVASSFEGDADKAADAVLLAESSRHGPETFTFGDPGPAQVVVEKLLDGDVTYQFALTRFGQVGE